MAQSVDVQESSYSGLCREDGHFDRFLSCALCARTAIPPGLASTDREEVRRAVNAVTLQQAAMMERWVFNEDRCQRMISKLVAAAAARRLFTTIARVPLGDLETARKDEKSRKALVDFLDRFFGTDDLYTAIEIGGTRAEFAERCGDFVAYMLEITKHRKKKTALHSGYPGF